VTESWGWPGFTAQVHFKTNRLLIYSAGDGRDSPLKYTNVTTSISPTQLGMAGIHRSSTLISLNLQRRFVLGMAGIHRSSTLADECDVERHQLGMAGIHRSSTLG
jgi:hypothetical protein